MNAFHQRIEFCLKVHNEAVKAMRYPPKKYNEDLETAQVRINFNSLVFEINFFFLGTPRT
jgi:26S proteasome regulatory subunit N3